MYIILSFSVCLYIFFPLSLFRILTLCVLYLLAPAEQHFANGRTMKYWFLGNSASILSSTRMSRLSFWRESLDHARDSKPSGGLHLMLMYLYSVVLHGKEYFFCGSSAVVVVASVAVGCPQKNTCRRLWKPDMHDENVWYLTCFTRVQRRHCSSTNPGRLCRINRFITTTPIEEVGFDRP